MDFRSDPPLQPHGSVPYYPYYQQFPRPKPPPMYPLPRGQYDYRNYQQIPQPQPPIMHPLTGRSFSSQGGGRRGQYGYGNKNQHIHSMLAPRGGRRPIHPPGRGRPIRQYANRNYQRIPLHPRGRQLKSQARGRIRQHDYKSSSLTRKEEEETLATSLGNKIGGEQALVKLPLDIFIDIFSRLPIKTIAYSKCAQDLAHHTRPFTFHSDASDQSISTRQQHGYPASRRGLQRTDESIYVCNPVIGDYMKLPTSELSGSFYLDQIAAGFGFSQVSNEYKVVRTYYQSAYLPGPGAWGEVYTFGSESWRKFESSPSMLPTGEF